MHMTASAIVSPSKRPALRRLRWLVVGLVLAALGSGVVVFALGGGDWPWRFWFLLLQSAAILMFGASALLLPNAELIRKPFLKADLSRVIREALDGKRASSV
jgi:MFS family permease